MKRNEIYGSTPLSDFSFDKLSSILKKNGVERLIMKSLAPNDNSKHGVVLGSNIGLLNHIPTTEEIENKSSSQKHRQRQKPSPILHIGLDFSWAGTDGKIYEAPHSKLVVYPQYPEIRFSGFMLGCKADIGPLINDKTKGRILLIGITSESTVIGFICPLESRINRELRDSYHKLAEETLVKTVLGGESQDLESGKAILMSELLKLHEAGWVKSKRMLADGKLTDCNATNCGGYTLEAQLGIRPNAKSEPDFLGWELKQYGVTSFQQWYSKPVTLMTPEPSAGFYKDAGVIGFLKRYGYRGQGARSDVLEFNGKHVVGKRNSKTKLSLCLEGFDPVSGKMTDADGGILLVSVKGEIAAKWDFRGLLTHWKRKHANAAFIPSQNSDTPYRKYKYGYNVGVGEGTDFHRFLSAIHEGHVYYDPGTNAKNISSRAPKTKRRSQFRISTKHLNVLYEDFQIVDIRNRT